MIKIKIFTLKNTAELSMINWYFVKNDGFILPYTIEFSFLIMHSNCCVDLVRYYF